MEDEIGKHSKEILSISQEKKGSFKEKTGKILLEIVIIVFSIMVSLWLANWNDKRKERAEVKEFLADLKEDLAQDTAAIRYRMEELKSYIEGYDFALNMTNQNSNVKLKFDIIPSQFNEGNYQGFQSSGKIGFIDNKNLKKQILAYYEQVLPALKEIEKEHLGYQKALWKTVIYDEYTEKSKQKKFSDPLVKAELNNAKIFGDFMVKYSKESLQEADSLLLVINKELK